MSSQEGEDIDTMLEQLNQKGSTGVIEQLDQENEDIVMQERILGEEKRVKDEQEQEAREEKERHHKIHRTKQQRQADQMKKLPMADKEFLDF